MDALRLGTELFLESGSGLQVECLLKSLAGEGVVLFDLVAGEEEGCPHGVERRAARVGGQFADVEIHSEQGAEGVAVFTPVESAQRDDPFLVAQGAPGGDHDLRQVLEEIGFLGRVGLFFLLGRHLRRVHRVEDLLPALGLLDGADDRGQIVHAELALLFFGAVAALAVFLEQGAVAFG